MWKKILGFFRKEIKKTDVVKHSSLRFVQTPVQDLVLGMYVSELDIPWLESPFMFRGFSIETLEQLNQLRDTCQYVYIDVSKQKNT